MRSHVSSLATSRRSLLKASVIICAAQVAAPFVIKARGETPIRIGVNLPLSGTYAAYGKNEQIGCELAVEEINSKGGILGRSVELLFEDSTSVDTGTAVLKARKLINRDKVDLLLGNLNGAMALAISQVSNESKTLHIVPFSHTDSITGANCHWNVFRVANSNTTLANAVAASLIKDGGKKWYYITPDYAYGHNMQDSLEKAAAKFGGTKVGGDFVPLGAADFSSYLIKAEAARPDIVILLTAGDDAINSMKQIVQFGFDKRFRIAGALQTQEVLEGLPPEARTGTWVLDWYWKQPDVPHVGAFVAATRQKSGKVPTASTWLDFVAVRTYALVANQEKTLDAVKLAKALGGFALPPEVALIPGKPYYRAADHQMVATSLYVGHAQPQGDEPEDLFHVDDVIDGATVAPLEAKTGCTMKWNI